MKKIIIVNNNMKIGGVQKSLHNLLWSIDTVNEYDVTLLLFSKNGDYAQKLPDSIKVKECKGFFRYLGKSQGEYKSSLFDFLLRGFFVAVSRIISRAFAFRLMLLIEPMLDGEFDCAISFLHNGRKDAFYGGTQDYVLKCVKAKKKVAFIHGDYINCGAFHSANNRLLEKFDVIAACSDGCRDVLIQNLPEFDSKCMTVRNFHCFDEIMKMSEDNSVEYDESTVNVIMVARLSHEKGIDRAIKAVAFCLEKNIKVKLHIVGGGSMEKQLKDLTKNLGVEENVVFYGEQNNPYRYMKNSDLLLIGSYHEAAPLVIDEARYMRVPVLSTKTTSTNEMIVDSECGWVCENSQEALNNAFYNAVSDKQKLTALKKKLSLNIPDNTKTLLQFEKLTSK